MDRVESCTTTVVSSGVVIVLIGARLLLRADLEFSAVTRSMLALTSAAVSALPEWNFTPSRRVNV
jgi:hypothetical protein